MTLNQDSYNTVKGGKTTSVMKKQNRPTNDKRKYERNNQLKQTNIQQTCTEMYKECDSHTRAKPKNK